MTKGWIAMGAFLALVFNPLTFEAWWLRYPDVSPQWVVRAWCWDLALLAATALLAFVARRPKRRETAADQRQHPGVYVSVLLAGVLAAGALLEVALRVTDTWIGFSPSLRRELRWRARQVRAEGSAHRDDSFAFSPTLGWELRPNVRTKSFTSNSQALRGSRESAFEPPPGTRRVICVGDSFTFGVGKRDEETMPVRLEVALNGDGFGRWETLNLGVPGYGTDQQWLTLAARGLRYKPDIVVLGFYERNVERNVMSFRDFAKPYFALVDGRLTLRNVPVPSPAEVLARKPELPRIRLISLIDTQAEDFRLSMAVGDFAHTPAGAVTLAILDAMREAVVGHGARFVVMSILSGVTRRGSHAEGMLARWAARTGTPFVNLREAYLKRPDGEHAQLYSGHWTPYGADVTARLLADELRRVGSIPK